MPLRGLCAVNDQHRLQSKRVYRLALVRRIPSASSTSYGTTAEGVGGTEQRGPKRAISAISAGGGW